jgi:hypothetical protein
MSLVILSRAVPHPVFGHFPPLVETGEGDNHLGLLPPLLAGEGLRRADKGPRG